MTDYEFLINEGLYEQLLNHDFAGGILLLGAKLIEEQSLDELIKQPELVAKKRTFITSSIVSQRLKKLNKESVIKKPKLIDESSGLIKYLITDLKPVEVYVAKDKLHLIILKKELSKVNDYFTNEGLVLLGLTYYDVNRAKERFNKRDNPLLRVSPLANDFLLIDLMNYLKREGLIKTSNLILLYKKGESLQVKATSLDGKTLIKPLVKYKERVVESEFDKFFKNDGFNEDEYNAFFN